MPQLPEPPPIGPAEGIKLFLPDEERCLEYLEKIRRTNEVYRQHRGKKNIKNHHLTSQ